MMIGYVNNLPRVVVSQERVTDRQTDDTAAATDDDWICEQLAQGCCEPGACDRQTDRRMIQQQQQMMIGYVNNLPRVVVSQERVAQTDDTAPATDDDWICEQVAQGCCEPGACDRQTDRQVIQQQQQMMTGYVTTSVNNLPRVVIS